MVSFDLHLLQSGFKLVKSDRNDAVELLHHCIPHDFPRCTVIANQEQYYQVINAMADHARKEVEQQQSSVHMTTGALGPGYHHGAATTPVCPSTSPHSGYRYCCS